MTETNGALVAVPRRSILGALAERYGMEAKALEMTLRKTVMPDKHSEEEFAACCMVAHEHRLNPITREIYFMRSRAGGIQPIVGVDGWIKKCNEHPAFDGMDFEDIRGSDGAIESIKCIIHRKDRRHPIIATEYLSECKRPTDNWKQMPGRMLRHRALIQCARIAFGFAGIMDPDEFEAWQDRLSPGTYSAAAVKSRIAELPMPPEIPAISTEVPLELDVEPLPDGYLDSLEHAYAAVKSGDMDSLQEVLVAHEGVEEQLSPEDRAKAVKLYKDHEARITL